MKTLKKLVEKKEMLEVYIQCNITHNFDIYNLLVIKKNLQIKSKDNRKKANRCKNIHKNDFTKENKIINIKIEVIEEYYFLNTKINNIKESQ